MPYIVHAYCITYIVIIPGTVTQQLHNTIIVDASCLHHNSQTNNTMYKYLYMSNNN